MVELHVFLTPVLMCSLHGVASDSLFGTYLRQCRVTFQEMDFEATSRLATEVCAYVREATGTVFFPDSNSAIEQTKTTGLSALCLREPAVIERILNSDATRVDKGVGFMTPAAVEKRMQDLESQVAEMPKQLFVGHLSAIQQGDYFLALEMLLRC